MAGESPKALILYYSNSNNTRKLALLAAEELGSRGWSAALCSLGEFAREAFAKPDLLLLGTPVHFWQVPQAAAEKIRGLPALDGVKAFVFCTYGTVFSSNVPYFLAKDLKSRGARILGGAAIAAPHNFLASNGERLGDVYEEFGKGQPDRQTLAAFREAVGKAAIQVEAGAPGDFRMASLRHPKKALTFFDGFVPVQWKAAFLAPVVLDPSLCRGCGLCMQNCDTGSITGWGKRPSELSMSTCKRCYTCVRECPSHALSVNWGSMEFALRGLKKVLPDKGSRIMA